MIEGLRTHGKAYGAQNTLTQPPPLRQRCVILVWAIPDGVLVVGQSTSMIVPEVFVGVVAGTADCVPLRDHIPLPLQADL